MVHVSIEKGRPVNMNTHKCNCIGVCKECKCKNKEKDKEHRKK